MKILTKSPVRNVWRLIFIVWMIYVAISLLSGIVAISPEGPAEKLFGINLAEPSLFAAYVTALVAVVITSMMLVLPALLLWALHTKEHPEGKRSCQGQVARKRVFAG